MVLATKLKSIKDNYFAKITTVLISIVVCIVLALNSFTVVFGLINFNIDAFSSEVTIYDFSEFRRELNIAVNGIGALAENNKYYDDEYNDIQENVNSYKNIKYCIVENDKVVKSNVDKSSQKDFIKNIKNYDYIIIDSENVQLADNLNSFKGYYTDVISDDCNKTIYIQINSDNEFKENDKFELIYQNYLSVWSKYSYSNQLKIAVVCLILLILISSIIIKLSGHKNGKLTTAPIDRIPNDIHFIISTAIEVALGVGIYFIVVAILEDSYIYDYFDLFKSGFVFAVVAFYLILIEFITSIVRQCKVHKNIFKNNLFYMLLALIFRGIKKLHKKNKEFLSYKLTNFKKRLVFFLISYGVLNLILFVADVFWLEIDFCRETFISVFMAGLTTFMLVALNIVSVIFVAKYVVDLDKIITASYNRTAPQVDYNKLPQSLKILVSSLQYTRTELQNAVNKAVKDERMRTELITNVSHDLKTPLTSIINYVDLLKQCDIQDDNAKEYITVLDEKGAKLKRLIDDLIEASKVTSGVINLNPVFLNFNELVTQAIVEHQQDFVNNNLELIFKGDKSNIMTFADGNKTFRVIENLLSNAQKYSAKGSRVYIDVYNDQQFSVFEIKNISAQQLDISPKELTERFVRGDKSRTQEGNGLGLSIADNLCKAMNGKLEILIDGDLFKVKVMLPKSK
jgi:signal transduction histidine kinase